MSRETFLQGMNGTLGTHFSGFPPVGQVENYFGRLQGRPVDEILEIYRDYVTSFYVHIAESSGNPSADVHYPGGVCDAWSEVTSRPLSHGRRIIDCEALAFMAHRLLTRAGFRPVGFQVLFIPTASGATDWHIMAVLRHPTEGQRYYLGTPRASTSAPAEARRVYGQNAHNALTAPLGSTPAEAVENMEQEAETDRAIEDVPLAPRRRSTVPPAVSDRY